jgi:CheY-like chemotaxis protein
MSLGKRESRKKDKAGTKPKRWFRRSSSETIEDVIDETQPSEAPLSDFDQLRESALETTAFEPKLLSVELSEPSSSSPAEDSVEAHHESAADDKLPGSFDIVEESSTHAHFIADSTVSYDHTQTGADLVASENWFESSADTFDEEQDKPLTEASLPETDYVNKDGQVIEQSEDQTSLSASDEQIDEVNDSRAAVARGVQQDERRRHPREDSSDLIWIEYFNAEMQCVGKEAARVENVGAGGMRVVIKTAPPEGVERVILSYAYRGFESCSVVRSRYEDESGQQHLCLEFADKDWKVNDFGAPVDGCGMIKNPRKILLADDDAAFRKILGNILTKAGYEVVLAADGEAAVKKAMSEKPDLVITDGLMPKLHGFQVCKAVKERNPDTKVIMLSAVYTTPNYLWEARSKFGADDMMTKPCEIAELLRKIETHLPSRSYAA